MGPWIVALVFAILAVASIAAAVTIHFQDERHQAECAMLADYALDMDDRCAALTNQALTDALAESERELEQCRTERRALALKLAEALRAARTIPIRRVDATKPRLTRKAREE